MKVSDYSVVELQR